MNRARELRFSTTKTRSFLGECTCAGFLLTQSTIVFFDQFVEMFMISSLRTTSAAMQIGDQKNRGSIARHTLSFFEIEYFRQVFYS